MNFTILRAARSNVRTLRGNRHPSHTKHRATSYSFFPCNQLHLLPVQPVTSSSRATSYSFFPCNQLLLLPVQPVTSSSRATSYIFFPYNQLHLLPVQPVTPSSRATSYFIACGLTSKTIASNATTRKNCFVSKDCLQALHKRITESDDRVPVLLTCPSKGQAILGQYLLTVRL